MAAPEGFGDVTVRVLLSATHAKREAEDAFTGLAHNGGMPDDLLSALEKVQEAQATWNLAVAEYGTTQSRRIETLKVRNG